MNRLWPYCAFVLGATSSSASISELTPSIEFLESEDIALLQTSIQSTFETGDWTATTSLAISDYAIDYVPASFDLLGSSEKRTENNYAIQINGRRSISDTLTLIGGAGYYEGFSSYSAIWLDTYFRQRFSDLSGVPGADSFIEADPKGINATLATRWEYLPASGFAQVSISQLRDDVSPGYEIDFDGLQRSEVTLATTSISVSSENILTPNMRSLLEFRASKTTDRDTRYSAQYSVNAAIGDRWIFRSLIGGSIEEPQFDSYFAQAAIEFKINDSYALYSNIRYYKDTGEIENALLFSSAAPGLDSRRFGLGVRFQKDNWKGRCYVAPISTHYQSTNPKTDFFQNLYKDRSWTIFQFSIERGF